MSSAPAYSTRDLRAISGKVDQPTPVINNKN
jgi:hypothetical protein